ncbi:NAD(P)-dependent oxidoreductase [Alkalihalobacterium bogoriense]|uniref:NAD(P)-dependent oxidoreductase n=1 Tax=Alkalihalobacterium bogoriense TaxID=246272 RepID=UPI00047DCBEE|nr:NAD(P)H-binding protein [Alkalihalobacterium bogoriense]
MNILIFGSTGRVGQQLLTLGIQAGYHVTAFLRNETKLLSSTPSPLRIFQGNVLHETDVMEACKGIDVIFSSLGTDRSDTLSKSMPSIIKAMEHHQISRFISIGTAGILNSRTEEGKYRFQTSESKRKSTKAANDHLKAFQALQKTCLEWTIVCPTYLPDGIYTGKYRVEKNVLPIGGKEISVPDTAEFAFSQLNDARFIRSRVGISY